MEGTTEPRITEPWAIEEFGLTVYYGDLWETEEATGPGLKLDALCITTNGTRRGDGSNVMGGGCALEAAERYPWLPGFYGQQIKRYGNHTFLIGPVVVVPVKHEVYEPADLDLIERSLGELVALADLYGWQRIALPTPGCGIGGLNWQDVGPQIASCLDARFIIVRYTGEPKSRGAVSAG